MSEESSPAAMPIPFNPRAAADVVALYGDAPETFQDLVRGVAGCSPFLRSLLIRERDWVLANRAKKPAEVLAEIHAEVAQTSVADCAKSLRRAKARVSLLTALLDLSGDFALEDVTSALTDFADFAVQSLLTQYLRTSFEAGHLPGFSAEDLESSCGIVVLAMGKMGAFELNYSSDIDLIVLFDETRLPEETYEAIRERFIRITRRLAKSLSEVTGEGYVFRTDLRLRPDPSVTPVCLSMAAAERYYESLGRTWERAAFIKARPAAGDLAAGAAFLKTLTPFVWRKHLDFAAIEDAHDMRLRIRAHKGLGGPITLPGHNMKLGRGGIREIEFFTQTRQIIAGGRDPDLRCSGTVAGLAKLADKGWISRDIAVTLTAAYRAHRRIEHRIQMIADAQSHELPNDDEGMRRLALFCGFKEVSTFEEDVKTRLEQVHGLIESFFAPDAPSADPAQDISALMDRWSKFPALRNARAGEIFSRILPQILSRVAETDHPEETLAQFEGFLAGLPAGVQLFSLFEANPQLISLLVEICGASPSLARYLARNSAVFDAVIGGAFFAPLSEVAVLAKALQDRLAAQSDYERQLNEARRWMKEQHFRIGVQQLKQTISSSDAARHYTDLAEAVLRALLTPVADEFARRHGPVPGRGLVVLGMGSLGAGNLSAASDLDLIVIYDADGAEYSEGKKPLAVQTYFARLTQALVTALSSPMAEGRLYEVDMRLRPSGRKGPVATSWQSFEAYQRDEAWTWEHLALSRARVIAGDAGLGAKVEAFREQILARPRDRAKILADVAEMRARLESALDKSRAQNPWETKVGAGRLLDIDLFGQTAALLTGAKVRDTGAQLATAQAAFDLTEAEVSALQAAWSRLSAVQQTGRLLSEGAFDPEALGPGGLEVLLEQTSAKNLAALERQLAKERQQTEALVVAKLG